MIRRKDRILTAPDELNNLDAVSIIQAESLPVFSADDAPVYLHRNPVFPDSESHQQIAEVRNGKHRANFAVDLQCHAFHRKAYDTDSVQASASIRLDIGHGTYQRTSTHRLARSGNSKSGHGGQPLQTVLQAARLGLTGDLALGCRFFGDIRQGDLT